MKKKLSIFIALCCIMFTFIACGNEGDTNNPGKDNTIGT